MEDAQKKNATSEHRSDDGERRRPRGPVADPHVEARMALLAEALRGVTDDAFGAEVNWDGNDDLDAGFLSIVKVLESSITPDRPTDDVPNVTWTTQQGS